VIMRNLDTYCYSCTVHKLRTATELQKKS